MTHRHTVWHVPINMSLAVTMFKLIWVSIPNRKGYKTGHWHGLHTMHRAIVHASLAAQAVSEDKISSRSVILNEGAETATWEVHSGGGRFAIRVA